MKRTPSKPARLARWTPTRVLYALILLGLLAIVLPSSWAARLRSIVQPLLPVQRGARAIADVVDGPTDAVPATITSTEYLDLLTQRRRLEHTVAALELRLTQLQADHEIVLATRTSGVGAAGKLVEALLLDQDAAPWRRSALLDGGTHHGVQPGAPVLTRKFVLDRGSEAGLAAQDAVLLGEVLIGVIEEAYTFGARVRLMSDPATQLEVHIGRTTETGFEFAPGAFWLTGAGRGEMVIRDAVKGDVDSGLIRVDDLVLAKPVETVLPTAMTLGRIDRIEPDLKNPLLSILHVRSEVDFGDVRKVYVYQPD